MEFVLAFAAFLAAAVLSIDGADIVTPLRIGAWNVQHFGKVKMSKPAVVSIMVQARDTVQFVLQGPWDFFMKG